MTDLDPLSALNAIGSQVTARYPAAQLVPQGADDALAVGVLTTGAPGVVEVTVFAGHNGEVALVSAQKLRMELYYPGESPNDVAIKVWGELRDVLRSGVEAVRVVAFLGPLSPSYVGSPEWQVIKRAKSARWAAVVASAQGWGEPGHGQEP